MERIRIAREAVKNAPPTRLALGPDRQQLLDLLK
jgi:hypothetical protein